MIEYQLILSSRRKSIALQIKSGEVTVRAPQGTSQQYIERLLLHKQSWIEAKLLAYQDSLNLRKAQENLLENNGQLWLKGVLKNIIVHFSQHSGVEDLEQTIVVHLKNSYQQLSLLQQNKKTKLRLR